MEHPVWGNISCYGNSYTAGITFSHAFFGDEKIEILLENGPENTLPDESQLQAYADTYLSFLDHIEQRLLLLQQTMFKVYMEDLRENNADEIDTLEQHNAYITHLAFIRIGQGDAIAFCFYYSLLNAPVHSVIMIGDQVYARYDRP